MLIREWKEIRPPAPRASSACPVCGNAEPHAHSLDDLTAIRAADDYLSDKLGVPRRIDATLSESSDV